MLTLYQFPKSRSDSIVWLLEELGVPYETKTVSIRRADGTGERDAANPHPHGKVPALVHDGHLVFESGAILLYLTDLFPQAGLGPVVGDANRGEYLSWLAYRTGVIEPSLMMRRFEVKHVYGAMGWGPADEVEQVLNDTLKDRPYILGDKFSAADISVGGAVHYLMLMRIMKSTPVLKDYAARITARPAFQKLAEKAP